jgi:SAM-dependent methyltransferase
MAHENQQEFFKKVKYMFPEHFEEVAVCDIGSLDINGNNRFLFTDYTYVGVDIGYGKNVDVVSKGHEYKPGKQFDVVISSECFEHDMYYKETIQNICENLLTPGGIFIFSCATTGRHEHGTRRTTPIDSPFTAIEGEWSDYYRNVTQQDVEDAIDLEKYFLIHHFYTNEETKDLYFWGVKKDQ